MKKVIVGSKNPVKIAAAKDAFAQVFPDEAFVVEGFGADSGVPDQPMGDEQTLKGAINRSMHAKEMHPDADYFVGMEGGCTDIDGEFRASAWIVVQDRKGKVGKGNTGVFILPEAVTTLIRGGMELGDADNQVFSRENSKHNDGAVGLLTNGLVTRTPYYSRATIFALIPFMQPKYY